MSLLIKALNKAEELQAQNAKVEQAKAQTIERALELAIATKNTAPEKTEATSSTEPVNKRHSKSQSSVINNADIELSLSPSDGTSTASNVAIKSKSIAEIKSNDSKPPVLARPSATATAKPVMPQTSSLPATAVSASASAKSAANVFSAKGVESSNQNTRLALIAGAGLIALLGMGLYFYQFVDSTPDLIVPPRPPIEQTIATAPQPLPEPSQTSMAQPELEPAAMPAEALDSTQEMQFTNKQEASIKKAAKKQDATSIEELEEAVPSEEPTVVADNSENVTEPVANVKPAKKMRQSKNNAPIASDSASIQVSKSSPQAGINPTLMSAYEAYNAGNDKDAIKLYKQVLQRDVHNVDALLGLGAIAARQGRVADANGWYSKVLEVEPRNNIALTSMLDSSLQLNQGQGNEQGNETRLKNMLAKNPDDANLHVALGNLYAEQNQWPAAQQAYFDAYSINKTADNAFNLAVSLDQMGKPKLALPYYQRALGQAGASSSIDKAALEARIAAIQ